MRTREEEREWKVAVIILGGSIIAAPVMQAIAQAIYHNAASGLVEVFSYYPFSACLLANRGGWE